MILLDIILVGLRDYQDQKADVIMKYNSDEARRLKNLGHLPDSVNVSRFTTSIFIKTNSFDNKIKVTKMNQTV